MAEEQLRIRLRDDSNGDMEIQMSQRVNELEEENNILWNQVAFLTNKLGEQRRLRKEAKDSCRKAKSILDEVRCLRVQVHKKMQEKNRLKQTLVEREKELRRQLKRQTDVTSQAEEELRDLCVFHRRMKQKYHRELSRLKMLNARREQQLHLESKTTSKRRRTD